jgi:hypothetical protein
MKNNLPPYSVLVTSGDKSAVYHALNGFWVPTDDYSEPLLSGKGLEVTRIDVQSFNRFWSHSMEILAEQYPDFKAGKLPLEWVDYFTATDDGKSDFVTAREYIVGEMIEKYIRAKFDVSKFDAVEVAECGVAAVATGPRYPGLVFERWESADDNDTPLAGSSIFTVYGHLSDGGVEALLDFDLESDADLAGEAVANIFGIDYGLGPKP